MKFLITGGAGFIGSEFVRQSSALGHSVLVLDELTYAGHLENLDECISNIQFRRCDITDEPSLHSVFDELNVGEDTTVVNFAAESHVDRSILSAKRFIETNVVGTTLLLEQATRCKVKKFIQISTDEVYGPSPLGIEFTETSSFNPTSPYAASKAAAELIVMSYQKTYGLQTVITRACNNFGPFQMPEKLIPRLILRGIRGMTLPIYGNGLQIREWMDVSTHANAIRIIAESDNIHDIYNLGSGFRVTNLELARMVENILGIEYSRIEFVTDRLAHDARYAVDSTRFNNEYRHTQNMDFFEKLRTTVDWYKSEEKNWPPLKDELFWKSEEIYEATK